ncbi:type VII secretion protein EccE [Streptacidiphilus sp. MAP12-16]|uniref:type VII secretion protein EccE n=1 Tax=Streptacidiphilus sp. MAP12-16 TaxID=3156300 RepID=UPI0035140D2B
MPSKTASPRSQRPDGPYGPPTGGFGPAPAMPQDRPSGAPVQVAIRPRPGRLGPLRLPQLILVETAAALVVIGLATIRIVLIPCGVAAVVLVLLALLRRNGLSPAELVRARAALRARQRRAAAAPLDVQGDSRTDPAMAPALECEPALRTVQHTVEFEGSSTTARRERREIGMIGDGTFLTAVIQVEAPDEPLRPARGSRPLPLDLLADGLQVDDIVVDAIQVVQYSQPSPAPHLPEQALAARGYRELPEGPSTPGLRMTWVAVRLDPELCLSAVAARGGGEVGARKSLQRAVDQLASRLVGAGLRAVVLDAGGVTAAVSTATCANPLRAGGAAAGATTAGRRTAETVRAWRCDDRWHTTYWVGQWPKLAPSSHGSGGARGGSGVGSSDLVNLLTGTPALGSAFSLTVRQASAGAVALSGQVRVTARGESELEQVTRQLESRARSAGVGLVRLDHEQVPGVLATLPLGGTR